jgi:hypothetical protein
MYVNNLHSLQELKENTWQEIFVTPRQKPHNGSRNIFSRCKACRDAED